MNQKVEVIMIEKEVDLIGYSYMFPKGSKVYIQKKVIDHKENKSTYQGIFLNKNSNTSTEMQFDSVSGVHLLFKPNEYDSKGVIKERPSSYCVKIDVNQF